MYQNVQQDWPTIYMRDKHILKYQLIFTFIDYEICSYIILSLNLILYLLKLFIVNLFIPRYPKKNKIPSKQCRYIIYNSYFCKSFPSSITFANSHTFANLEMDSKFILQTSEYGDIINQVFSFIISQTSLPYLKQYRQCCFENIKT